MKTHVICIANHKGGIGKTTTAVTLATGFSAMGKSTTLIDCDPQGNCASFLGKKPMPGLHDWLIAKQDSTQISYLIDPNLTLIPGDDSTVDVETLLRTSLRYHPQKVIAQAVKQLDSKIIILDTAPSLSSIQIAALCAANWLLIPASPEYASETGISALVSVIDQLQSTGQNNTALLGILPTFVQTRTREHKATIDELKATFPGMVLPPVRRRIAIAEAPRAGVPIWDYDEKASQDYSDVLYDVMGRLGL
jgi:chromosome partitioning protein